MADFKLADKLFPEEESLPLKPEGRSCAGLVLIAHGYNLKIIGEPNWTVSMQKAIYRRLRSNGKMGKIEVTGNKKNLKINCKWFEATGTGKSDSDIILRLDWSDVANYLVSGISTRQIAARILTLLSDKRNELPELDSMPLHLIGHSRGASIVCELARLLAEKNIKVDQVTTLDPHPLTKEDPQNPTDEPVIDAPVKKYGNICFMDNYWQDISYPRGQYIDGAFNRCWHKLPGGYHRTIHAPAGDHWNIILIYQGTITGKFPVENGEAEFSEQEWAKLFLPEDDLGKSIGYNFSIAVAPELRGK